MSRPDHHPDSQGRVLARSATEKKLEDKRLELRAKRRIAIEQKNTRDVEHCNQSHVDAFFERRLRKIATRGVVQLFNAIRIRQNNSKSGRDIIGHNPLVKKSKKVKQRKVDKTKFLELLRS